MTDPHRFTIQRHFGPLSATVEVPGSKSLTNRALVCAALAKGPSKLFNIAPGDDTLAMIDGLTAMGARCIVQGFDVDIVTPIDRAWGEEVTVNANLAGTTSRFLTAVAALRTGCTTVTGDHELLLRPMAGLFESLSLLGAKVTTLEEPGHLPVRVCGGYQTGHELTVRGDTSSQFITALLLIGPALLNGLKMKINGPIVSEPYLAMTCSVMNDFGAEVNRVGIDLFEVQAQGYRGRHFVIEPDASSASYPLAAAAIVGGSVTVTGIGESSVQGDKEFVEVLRNMGCSVRSSAGELGVSRNAVHPLRGIELNMASMSDLVPTVAVVAMYAATPTRISGVGFIRSKESDRLNDLANELRKLGGEIEVTSDGLVVHPSQVHGGVVETHRDHRIAMALSLVGLTCDGVVIVDPDVVSKSWPGYWTMLRAL
ncbi:MAG: 3-phosphoshikimate 1-carboxyvinyltransferase [Ilumatobacteraceae bacterium]